MNFHIYLRVKSLVKKYLQCHPQHAYWWIINVVRKVKKPQFEMNWCKLLRFIKFDASYFIFLKLFDVLYLIEASLKIQDPL